MSEPILTLADVVVAFDALRAVDGVSLTVPRGQRRAIIGPNGAGKTTLFNAIAGALPPTGGRIAFRRPRCHEAAAASRAQLGISRTFQITNLFPRLSVQDNMVLALRGRSSRKFSLFGKPDVDGVEAPQIAAALDAVRIAARADVMVKDLSYGEQRQLEIALSLVTSPRLLLLDEPAAGLSPSERSMVAEIIRALDRGHYCGFDRARHGSRTWPGRSRHLHVRGARSGRGIAGRDPPQQAGAGSLSAGAASCLRFAI
ncbi:MAG: ATP-binding cassette domain-containing protein [Bradyrhizobium sp.]